MYWVILAGIMMLAMLIPAIRARVRYFFMYFVFFTTIFIGAVVYSIKFFLSGKPRYSNSSEFVCVYKLARYLTGLQPRVYGRENYDRKQQYIYIVNHQSFIDVLCEFKLHIPYFLCVNSNFFRDFHLALADIWQTPSTVIAKSTLKYFGPLGAILYYTKCILIHRGDHQKAISEMNRTAEQIVNDKVNLFMFPEGTRNSRPRMLPFKKGAFHLAIQTQVPILPVVISHYNAFLDHKTFFYDPVPYGVYVLPPIVTAGLDSCQVSELMEHAHTAMSAVFERTVGAAPQDLGSDLTKKTL